MEPVFIHPRAICECENIGAGTRVWACAHVLPNARIGEEATGGFNGIVKYDLVEGTSEHVLFGEGRFGGEPIFAPRDSATEEDDGWVVGFVYDSNTDSGECVVIDAQNFEAGPVARIKLPQRVPYGFHAAWVNEAGIAANAAT